MFLLCAALDDKLTELFVSLLSSLCIYWVIWILFISIFIFLFYSISFSTSWIETWVFFSRSFSSWRAINFAWISWEFKPFLLRLSNSFKYMTYFWSLRTISALRPLNSTGLTFITMCLALSTNFKVLRVSSRLVAEGETLPTINVNVFEVRDYCRSLVSLDSLKEATALPPVDRL